MGEGQGGCIMTKYLAMIEIEIEAKDAFEAMSEAAYFSEKAEGMLRRFYQDSPRANIQAAERAGVTIQIGALDEA